jgi:hypothetical protein
MSGRRYWTRRLVRSGLMNHAKPKVVLEASGTAGWMQWQIYPVMLHFRGNQSTNPSINQSCIQKASAGDWHGQQMLESDSAYPLSASRQSQGRSGRDTERDRDGGRIGSGNCRGCSRYSTSGRYSMRCGAVIIGGRLCVCRCAPVYLCLLVHVGLHVCTCTSV